MLLAHPFLRTSAEESIRLYLIFSPGKFLAGYDTHRLRLKVVTSTSLLRDCLYVSSRAYASTSLWRPCISYAGPMLSEQLAHIFQSDVPALPMRFVAGPWTVFTRDLSQL